MVGGTGGRGREVEIGRERKRRKRRKGENERDRREGVRGVCYIGQAGIGRRAQDSWGMFDNCDQLLPLPRPYCDPTIPYPTLLGPQFKHCNMQCTAHLSTARWQGAHPW